MSEPEPVPTIVLRKGCDRRLIQGHDWVFSNEIEPRGGDAPPLEAGQLVHVRNRQGRFLGAAYYNPRTLIAARLVSACPLTRLDAQWLDERLLRALELRETLFREPYYRWVHSEGDSLPGLIIDRFGPYLSLQINTAGMERLRPLLRDLPSRFDFVRGLVIRTDDSLTSTEGIAAEPLEVIGEVPQQVAVREGPLEFQTDLTTGQKTGWFFDQRSNRQSMIKYLNGGPLLDLFCYLGAWGITAAKHGAQRVTAVDSSDWALTGARNNAALNGVELETIAGDAFDVLRQLQNGQRFQVVVLDPPALIKRRKDFENGLQAYYQLNRLAAKLLLPNGILISCSCSHHLPAEQLLEIVHHAARSVGRRPVVTEIGQQSPDHPRQPAIVETGYLKAIFCQLRELDSRNDKSSQDAE